MWAPGDRDGADARVGTTFARLYFVHQLLGSGGMADVYKATRLDTDRQVALKVVRTGALPDAAATRRFEREAAVAARLRHPCVVEVLECGCSEDGTRYLAMELVPGRTLAQVIAREGPLPEARAVHLASQVLEALAQAHSAGVIHRDVKPGNVMVHGVAGEPERVKVLDFGIATVADPGEGASRLTQDGMVHGTPAYMSPEQIRGEPLDARSDLYSTGVLVFEMLTGAPPFDGPSNVALAVRHLTDPAPPLSARRAGVAPALEAVVARALEKDPARRPASATRLKAELLAALGAPASAPRTMGPPPTDAFPGPIAPAVPRRVIRRRVAAIAAAGSLLALGIAALLAGGPRRNGRASPPPAIGEPALAPPAPLTSTVAASPSAAPTQARAVAPPAVAPASSVAPERVAAPRRPARVASPASALRVVRGELNSVETPAAATGDGVLVLQALPWAEVSVDGQVLGETPREVRLPAGPHAIRAVHPELGVREERVTVGAGERRLWAVRFDH